MEPKIRFSYFSNSGEMQVPMSLTLQIFCLQCATEASNVARQLLLSVWVFPGVSAALSSACSVPQQEPAPAARLTGTVVVVVGMTLGLA